MWPDLCCRLEGRPVLPSGELAPGLLKVTSGPSKEGLWPASQRRGWLHALPTRAWRSVEVEVSSAARGNNY